MENNTCCFIGHRTINETEELKINLYNAIETLINQKQVDTFLFGSKSRFNALCLELVTQLKERYPHIKRIYVRAEFPAIDQQYHDYLLQFYDQTYFPETLLGSGRAIYVKRNREMIRRSGFCVFYYHENQAPTIRKSGTKIALDYAIKQKRRVTVFPRST